MLSENTPFLWEAILRDYGFLANHPFACHKILWKHFLKIQSNWGVLKKYFGLDTVWRKVSFTKQHISSVGKIHSSGKRKNLIANWVYNVAINWLGWNANFGSNIPCLWKKQQPDASHYLLEVNPSQHQVACIWVHPHPDTHTYTCARMDDKAHAPQDSPKEIMLPPPSSILGGAAKHQRPNKRQDISLPEANRKGSRGDPRSPSSEK